jgi:putative ABC transport system permease protein
VRLDLRHAIRALRATPSFTIGALLVLALGTGATTAIFSVVDAVVLRPLPFPEPDRIVAVGVRVDAAVGASGGPQRSGPAPLGKAGAMPGAKPPDPDALMSITAQDYLDWAEQQQVFEAMAAFNGPGDYVLQPPGAEPALVKGAGVTASFFDVLRARPVLGASFTSSDAIAGDRLVVVSYDFWQRHLGRDTAAVGRALALNGESHTIIGVMPSGFAYPPESSQAADLWTLWVPRPQDQSAAGRGARQLGGTHSIARLKPDVSLDQAQAQLSQVAATIAAGNPTASIARRVGIRPLRDHLVGTSTRWWMLMLLAAAGFVLLIACANVANLWLARASVQEGDAAIRAALGASRGRLVQRVLIESLAVSAAGLVVGLAIAWTCIRVLAAALPESIARVSAVGIDARVSAVAAVAALVTGLVSGLAPALQGSSYALATVLNGRARGGTGRARRRTRAMLVVAELALAVVLLVAASLSMGSFINVMRIDPGFRSERVLAVQLGPETAQADLRPALAEIVDRARHLPGVATKMSGTVTGTSDKPRKWSAEKKK